MPLSHARGQAQCDFGEALVVIGGVERKAHCSVIDLPHKRRLLRQGLSRGDHRGLPGWPRIGVRLSGRSAPEHPLRQYQAGGGEDPGGWPASTHRAFTELQSHYLFEDRFGRPARGNDKGKVEGLVGYMRRNFLVLIPSFESFDSLNAHLEQRCLERMDAQLRGHTETIGQRMERDLDALLPLPPVAYDACEKQAGRVSSLSLVRYRTNDYSVPVAYGYRDVLIRGYVDVVVISCGSEAHCLTQIVTQRKWLPQLKCYRKLGKQPRGRRHQQDGEAGTCGDDPGRYQQASKKDKGKILDEFTAITGYHRKHGIRLLNGIAGNKGKQAEGRRIYDEAVREAVIVVWEASDRICGKRLKAALANFVDSMERHGHLSLDPVVRERLLSVRAATLDRLLRPTRANAGSRRNRRRRTYMGSQIPVRTYNDWNWPPPGFLEIDLVAHCGGIYRVPLSTAWWPPTSARDGRRQFPCWPWRQSLVVQGLEAIAGQLPFSVLGIDSDNDSVFINQTLMEYCADRGIEFTRSRAYRKND